MKPTLDEALGSSFGAGPAESAPWVGEQAGAQTLLSKVARDQAEAQLAMAQKAINSLKHCSRIRLNNPTNWNARERIEAAI